MFVVCEVFYSWVDKLFVECLVIVKIFVEMLKEYSEEFVVVIV